ncbi:MAG: hypothetical protein IKM44_01215 [Clostridia bacterium]|nr:hypothetical protein [Clostridia bacterium]
MKGRTLKIILSLSLIICIGMFGIVMTSCDNYDGDIPDTPTEYKVAFNGNANYRSNHLDFIALCNSYEELKEACSQNNYYFFNRDEDFHEYDKDYDSVAGEKIRGYTTQYFNDKSLVICAFMKREDFGKYVVDAVEVDTGKLTLKIKYPRSETANEALTGYFFIVEVNKPFVKDVTNTTYVYV